MIQNNVMMVGLISSMHFQKFEDLSQISFFSRGEFTVLAWPIIQTWIISVVPVLQVRTTGPLKILHTSLFSEAVSKVKKKTTHFLFWLRYFSQFCILNLSINYIPHTDSKQVNKRLLPTKGIP